MVTYPSYKPTARKSVVYDKFSSVNFAQASTNIDVDQSPNALNMVRDEYNKVRKRMGYFKKFQVEGQVYGITFYKNQYYVHAGTNLYRMGETTETVFTTMNEAPSFYYQQNDLLYVLDGKNFISCSDTGTAENVAGKIPIVIISGSPNGGGTQYEQVNLLQDKWEQHFIGDGTTKEYQLAFQDLDDTPVEVQTASLVDDQVTWTSLVEGTDFTVDRELGIVTFTTAPSRPVVAQEDNVKITASKDRSEQRNKVLQCTVFVAFGVNGYDNQIFATCNSEFGNYLFWSDIEDITYWGDLQYAVLGQENSDIVSLNALNTQLVAHKDPISGSSYVLSVFTTEINELITAQVKVDKVISGSGCICKYGSQRFGEPLFITQLGVQTITYKDLSNYEVETLRGDRITRKLLAEPNLENAITCVYKYYYMIAINGNVYLLDRLNPRSSGSVLNNAYQYNAFFWNDVPATCLFPNKEVLLFGTANGEVMEFYTDDTSPLSYNDNGKAYEWLWEFPEYVGNLFYTNKTIKYIALRAKAYVNTSVTIDIQLEGQWYEVISDNSSFGFLDLSYLNLNNLNLSTDATPKKTSIKYSERKLDKLAFRIRGNSLNEPFGLYSFAFEVKENGKHKG